MAREVTTAATALGQPGLASASPSLPCHTAAWLPDALRVSTRSYITLMPPEGSAMAGVRMWITALPESRCAEVVEMPSYTEGSVR